MSGSTVHRIKQAGKPKLTKANLVPGLLTQIRVKNLPAPVQELPFDVAHGGRGWRFDFAWPAEKIALEIEGGAFAKGGSRHTRGAGFREDRVKYGTAFARGWTVLSVMPEQVKSGQAVDWLTARFRAMGHA